MSVNRWKSSSPEFLSLIGGDCIDINSNVSPSLISNSKKSKNSLNTIETSQKGSKKIGPASGPKSKSNFDERSSNSYRSNNSREEAPNSIINQKKSDQGSQKTSQVKNRK
jgi:hypothetical protein